MFWSLNDELWLLVSRVTCYSKVPLMSSSLYKTAATTTLLQFITCSWSASRSIEAASCRVVQRVAVSKGRGAPRSAMARWGRALPTWEAVCVGSLFLPLSMGKTRLKFWGFWDAILLSVPSDRVQPTVRQQDADGILTACGSWSREQFASGAAQ